MEDYKDRQIRKNIFKMVEVGINSLYHLGHISKNAQNEIQRIMDNEYLLFIQEKEKQEKRNKLEIIKAKRKDLIKEYYQYRRKETKNSICVAVGFEPWLTLIKKLSIDFIIKELKGGNK